MPRRFVGLVVTVLALAAAPPAHAEPSPFYNPKSHAGGMSLVDRAVASWTSLLEAPASDNPLAGTADPCVMQGRALLPTAPPDVEELTCTVAPGTPVVILGFGSECSTAEAPPFYGTDEASLRACALAANEGVAMIDLTVDGRTFSLLDPAFETVTPLMRLTIPEDAIFEARPGPALSVGHQWMAVLKPLRPGTHEIVLRVAGTFPGEEGEIEFPPLRLTLIVEPGTKKPKKHR